MKAQSQYITDFFNEFEAAVFSSDFTDPENGYRKYLDLDSFLRYFILCELDGNIDSFWSTYMWKDRNDDVLHAGPIWDIDLGFQNVGEWRSVYDFDRLSDYIYLCNKASAASESMRSLVTQIVKKDEGAKERLKYIWSDLRYNHNFNAEYYLAKIDEYAAQLDESQRLNFTRWPILNKSVQKDQAIFGSYEGELDNVRSYITKRFPRLDSFIGLDESAAIGTVMPDEAAESDAVPVLYDLRGQRVDADNAAAGIYIRRCGEKVEKVLVK